MSGEWICGDLFHIAGATLIYHGSNTDYDKSSDESIAVCLYPDEVSVVDPDTVGQFTGLKDKDGKDIFEGDIIQNASDRYIVTFTQGMFYASIQKKGHIGGFPLWYLTMELGATNVIGNISENIE